MSADRAAVVVDAMAQPGRHAVEVGAQEFHEPRSEPVPPGAVGGQRPGDRGQQREAALRGEPCRFHRLGVEPGQQDRRQGRL